MSYNRCANYPDEPRRDDNVSDATIEVTGLRKRSGPTVALDGMTFTWCPAG
jgi:hypothetical protein